MTLREFIDLYYDLPDQRKAKAFHVEREACIDLFQTTFELHRNWLIDGLFLGGPITRAQVAAMLELGDGRVLGLPVVLSDDKCGVWLECEVVHG